MNSTASRPLGESECPGKSPATRLARTWWSSLSWITNRRRQRRLLFLDDDPARARSFLTEYPQAVWVENVPACIDRLAEKWDEVHLDHDLGGRTFVDTTRNDCGMEVIRWICKEPRAHLRRTLFFVHTHNAAAGLLMVLQMRSSGYKAEFRPFGFNLAHLLAREQAGPNANDTATAVPDTRLRRCCQWLLRWRKKPQPAEAPPPRDRYPDGVQQASPGQRPECSSEPIRDV
jgi:hypothetical protein